MSPLSMGYVLLKRLRNPHLRAWVVQQYSRQAARLAATLRAQIAGKPVVIIGSSPGIDELSAEQRARLSSRFFTIGLNRVFYRYDLDLFLSAYPLEHAIARLHRDRIRYRVQIRPESRVPVIRGSVAWQRVVLGSTTVAYALGDGQFPVVRTKLNVALAATDMAVRLGAATVYYLGVEQNNRAHYYDLDEPLRQAIIKDCRRFAQLGEAFTLDHHDFEYEEIMRRFDHSPEELLATSFYQVDHIDSFNMLFSEFAQRGTRFVSMGSDTIVARAGADVASLDEVLEKAD